MKSLNIYFCDFWNDFDKSHNLFVNVLSKNYIVNLQSNVNDSTDLIICSLFGSEHIKYINTKKKIVYYSGENDFPTFLDYDYAITHTNLQYERHLRIPLWVLRNFDTISEFNIENDTNYNSASPKKFCADVISNTGLSWPLRFTLSDKLSEYKQVDHGGSYKNNVGGPVADKIEFLKNYKFSIASENSMTAGYVTEKIFDSFKAGTIPIYLGDNYVIKDFNPDSFINVNDFKSYSDLIKRIKDIDENDEIFLSILNTKKTNMYSEYVDQLENFLINIIENGSKFCHKYGRMKLNVDMMINLFQ